MKRIYLDYAATTPTHSDVFAAMEPYFGEKFGNPSSIHSFGRETRSAVEKAREQVAALISAKPEEIVFTSGGTESNNFALNGIAEINKTKGNHLITSRIEHPAVLEPCQHLDKHGLINSDDVKKAITDKTILVSIMMANNEIGVIEPIEEINRVIKDKLEKQGQKIYFHVDAVQAFGAIPIDVNKLGMDLLSCSGHKLYGPKGVGALYIRKGTRIAAFMRGGHQEKNRRASTENVPGLVGFGKACELALRELDSRVEHLTGLRDKLIKGLLDKIPETQLNGHPTRRLPNNVNVSVRYIEGESMLLNLDMEGIAASTGSACTSGTLDPSHVLLAIGLPHEIAHGSVRFTLGRLTTQEDIDHVLDVFPKIVEKLRAMSPLYKKG